MGYLHGHWKGYPYSLVPSLSARQIFIAYSMKNRRGKSENVTMMRAVTSQI